MPTIVTLIIAVLIGSYAGELHGSIWAWICGIAFFIFRTVISYCCLYNGWIKVGSPWGTYWKITGPLAIAFFIALGISGAELIRL